MKLFIKTSNGSHFEIEASPSDTVADVKKKIKAVRGLRVYRALGQMLIYQGKVLRDDSDRTVISIIVSLETVRNLDYTSSNTTGVLVPTDSTLSDNKVDENSFILMMSTESEGLAREVSDSAASSKPSSKTIHPTPTNNASGASVPVGAPPEASVPSNQATMSNFEETVQQLIDMGGGAWNRDIVIQALGSALNNPELAVEYLYSGYPNAGSNASATPNLGFLRNSHQFQALRAMVQADPETLQPLLQEFGKKNPNIMRLIEEHHDEFLRLLNESVEGGDGNVMGQLDSIMPQAIQVTPQERDAIVRLEAMGFDRALVLEVFFAFNKNEELAANYLLDHMDEFDDR